MQIFATSFLSQYLSQKKRKLTQEINAENRNQLLNYDQVTYIEYLVKIYSIEPINFKWDEAYTTAQDEKVLPKKSPNNILTGGKIDDLFSKVLVITWHLPFTGDPILLEKAPSSNHIRWPIEIIFDSQKNEIQFKIPNCNTTAERINATAEDLFYKIRQQSDFCKEEINQYNATLEPIAQDTFDKRKEKLLREEEVLKNLSIPIKLLNDSNIIPVQQKKIFIKKPEASEEAYISEPQLEQRVYKEILTACHQFGIRMERLPSTYKDKDEQAIRDNFLLLLDMSFEYATGETFNKNGKTDILIRYEGKNAFIAECKFWHGEKKHYETIDQILSYLTWRDSKAAILYFVENKNLQPVLNTIENSTSKHSACIKYKEKKEESWFNYHFHLTNDKTRGVELAVLVFHFNA